MQVPKELQYYIITPDIIPSCIFVNKTFYEICKYMLDCHLEDVIAANIDRLELKLIKGYYCNFLDTLIKSNRKQTIISTCVSILHHSNRISTELQEIAMEKIISSHCICDVIGSYVHKSTSPLRIEGILPQLIQSYLYTKFRRLFSKRYACNYNFATWMYFLLVTPTVIIPYRTYSYMYGEGIEEPVIYNEHFNSKLIINATIDDIIKSKLSNSFSYTILRILRGYSEVKVKRLYKLCKRSKSLVSIRYFLQYYELKDSYVKKLNKLL